MLLSLKGKKAIVTGGGSGLCKGIAQALHASGAEVVLVSHTQDTYDTAIEMESEGAKVHAVVGDLSTKPELDRIYEECLQKLGGRLDILVNGAGIQFRSPAVDFPEEEWHKVIRVNLDAVFFMAQNAGRTMLKQKYGKIINIASMTSFIGSELIPAYTASKAGVAQLTKALSNEWARDGINVNAIAPGYMATALTASIKEKNFKQYEEISSRIPMGRWGNAEDLQGIAVFLASDASAYISGAVIPVDGGMLGK
jgi:2-dehydro-3-deoxy-D-gluconate 5-dehydrogenase